jgi:hypothetical protein
MLQVHQNAVEMLHEMLCLLILGTPAFFFLKKNGSISTMNMIDCHLFLFIYACCKIEGQAWCSWWVLARRVIRSWPPGFEAVSLQNFCGGKTLLRLFPSPDPTRVGASGTGSALFFLCMLQNDYALKMNAPCHLQD